VAGKGAAPGCAAAADAATFHLGAAGSAFDSLASPHQNSSPAGTVRRRRLSALSSAALPTSRRSRGPRPPRRVGVLPELDARPVSRRGKKPCPFPLLFLLFPRFFSLLLSSRCSARQPATPRHGGPGRARARHRRPRQSRPARSRAGGGRSCGGTVGGCERGVRLEGAATTGVAELRSLLSLSYPPPPSLQLLRLPPSPLSTSAPPAPRRRLLLPRDPDPVRGTARRGRRRDLRRPGSLGAARRRRTTPRRGHLQPRQPCASPGDACAQAHRSGGRGCRAGVAPPPCLPVRVPLLSLAPLLRWRWCSGGAAACQPLPSRFDGSNLHASSLIRIGKMATLLC